MTEPSACADVRRPRSAKARNRGKQGRTIEARTMGTWLERASWTKRGSGWRCGLIWLRTVGKRCAGVGGNHRMRLDWQAFPADFEAF